jgi:hypothetical protein
MRAAKLVIAVLCMAVAFEGDLSRAEPPHNQVWPDRLFDEYGRIRWEDEQARLDNFAIQVTNEPDAIGYIFVYDGANMCAGEVEARAIRAKRYIVEHRGVPWNRVIWRKDGYRGEFRIVLQPVSRAFAFAVTYPFLGITSTLPEVHATKNCKTTMAQIKRSKWN